MTDCRVPRCSERIDTTPYATSGTTAAMPRSSANRVAMCLMRMTSVVAGHLRCRDWFPQPQIAEHVPTRIGRRHVDALADRLRALLPREQDRLRVVHHRLLERDDVVDQIGFGRGMAHAIQCGIEGGAVRSKTVAGMPDLVRTKQRR